MLKIISSIISGKGLLLLLVASLAGSGWLLLKANQEIGQQEAENSQLMLINKQWSVKWQARDTEYKSAVARLSVREAAYQKIQGELNDYQEKLRAILADSTGDDCGVRPSVWMLIKDSAAGPATGSLPGDQPSATSDN